MWRCLIVASVFGGIACGQAFHDFTTPLPLKPGDTLILGFLGAVESWDDDHRGVRKTALSIRALQTPGVYVETLANRKHKLALELIERAFDWNGNQHLDDDECAGARVILYGQSLGGAEVVKLARELETYEIPVRLTVQVDSVGRGDVDIPRNVREAVNFYQREGLVVRGESHIRAIDSKRTRILGNFEYSTKGKQVDGPWIRRTLGGAHTRMELDPGLWREVQDLILSSALKH